MIHHIDEDETNDDSSNLTAMHRPCHVRLHLLGTTRVGKPHTDETKQKVREARLGTTLSDETRTKIRESLIGKPHSMLQWRCGDCQMVSNGGGLATHQRATGHLGRSVKVS